MVYSKHSRWSLEGLCLFQSINLQVNVIDIEPAYSNVAVDHVSRYATGYTYSIIMKYKKVTVNAFQQYVADSIS